MNADLMNYEDADLDLFTDRKARDLSVQFAASSRSAWTTRARYGRPRGKAAQSFNGAHRRRLKRCQL